ncbi:MAG TPA: hypothetical protein VGS41_16910, partial [Chthonomonadales bacterium]|nr:hypothetical protein [Chthonomonadales bacterium]
IVHTEGFLRNGHVYAYWGITGALLRLPLLLFHRLDMDITWWSCLVAVCIAGFMKIRTVLFLRRSCLSAPGADAAFGLMLACILFGGAEIAYLRSSIFQEVVFWAIAFAAIFVYFAIKGLVSGRFTAGMLSRMAFAAGLAVLTRVSTGIGLYAALGLLLLVLLAEESRGRRALLTRRIFLPLAIMAAFLFAAGAGNYFRWGNPATFADYSLYLGNIHYPDRILRTRLYGLFNLIRIPFGLLYYFFPIWVLQGAGGRLLFESTQTRLMDNVELPPGSFFLTDLLPLAFIAFLTMAIWARRRDLSLLLRTRGILALCENPLPSFRISCAEGLALAAGLAAPCVLMLSAISMNYRYRMEFYPEIDLLAFLGLYATVTNPALLIRFNRRRRWMLGALVVTIVSAFTELFLYKLSYFGPSQELLRHGIVHFYIESFRSYRQFF